MGRKKGITANVSSSAEAAQLTKKSKKELGKDIKGSPDEWDRKNLRNLIDSFELAYPGLIKRMATAYAVEKALSTREKKFGVVYKESETRQIFWLPAPLQQVIEAAYPSFWGNKQHAIWFVKNFPEFKAADKI